MESELHELRRQLQEKTKEINRLNLLLREKDGLGNLDVTLPFTSADTNVSHPDIPCETLSNASIARYSRQLILPEVGVKGQLALANASVLIVGAGGLGCPAALYLAAAGTGCLGLLDYDTVELSNLHRQVLHTEQRVSVPKSSSAAFGCNQLNSTVRCIPYHMQLDSQNALQLLRQYDVVLDCTDNVATRYLLNDACIMAKKPLISGSALRFEGQLTVYNYQDGPCYRCLYPTPPPPETVTNCSDGGVLGVIPGIIGCLQALEAVKVICSLGNTYSQRLLLFDGLEGTFRTIKLRPRQQSCVVCGDNPSVTKLIDYEQFCGSRANDKEHSLELLKPEDRISAKEYQSIVKEKLPHLLIDVRLPVEQEICSLPGAWNIPIGDIHKEECLEKLRKKLQETDDSVPVYLVCRRGNDSQEAVKALKEKLKDMPHKFKDIYGGLHAWSKHVDTDFPVY
ncbi:adenylyltransferase and sulfurtransferase MOCS3 [Lingula anatina]|uniref:Adenylyltransferase and sulfurtransferase MOCS3 homolog n=1 Tax=Lingula anatina TaxID=7574 RepID=A0A1S3J2P2_LINAN|nr:adenylyltransferase and sulfurtransferase MOCS3 [Lingula anatina]|eukprot:XP_013404551.1 adenylyltransferase and sulfurtransferase MOCS3 [Lingula anatina]